MTADPFEADVDPIASLEMSDDDARDYAFARNWEPEIPALEHELGDPERIAQLRADREAHETELRAVVAHSRAEHKIPTEPNGDGHGIVRMSTVDPEHVDWLWSGRIPLGKLTLVDGDPGRGKSTFMLDLAARVTTGSPLPDGTQLGDPRSVVLMTAEDGLADTVRPRLDAAGADPARVVVIEAVPVYDDEGNMTLRPPSLPRDLGFLERVIREEKAALGLIDVLAAYLGADVDGHVDKDVRRALMPLAKMAERTGAAIIAARHLTKARGGNAIYAGGGSIGIIGAARSALIIGDDPSDETGDRRILAVAKSNLAAIPTALAYRLVSAHEHGCARIEWLGATDHTADDLVSVESREQHTERDEATDFLRELLADGPMAAKDTKAAARGAGIAERTLTRARQDLHVVVDRAGFPAVSTWRLRATPPPTHTGGPTGEGGPTVTPQRFPDHPPSAGSQLGHPPVLGPTGPTDGVDEPPEPTADTAPAEPDPATDAERQRLADEETAVLARLEDELGAEVVDAGEPS
jgi:AAA domain